MRGSGSLEPFTHERLEELTIQTGGLPPATVRALGQCTLHLNKLDLHHHFMSEAVIQRLRQALPEVEVNVDERLEPEAPWREDMEPFRYIAVAE